jgi:2-amino-4-hydroxy-6-hydroxymethyldihydropteridine diphosphokinase
VGDKKKNLHKALQKIEASKDISILRKSSIYETDPVDFIHQPAFYNMAIEVDTTLLPDNLLSYLLSIEESMHRIRDVRFGPRNIDLDILLYGDQMIKTPSLTIPHPRMHQRGFVLIPLLEIAGNLKMPSLGDDLSTLIGKLPKDQKVQRKS